MIILQTYDNQCVVLDKALGFHVGAASEPERFRVQVSFGPQQCELYASRSHEHCDAYLAWLLSELERNSLTQTRVIRHTFRPRPDAIDSVNDDFARQWKRIPWTMVLTPDDTVYYADREGDVHPAQFVEAHAELDLIKIHITATLTVPKMLCFLRNASSAEEGQVE